MNIARLAELFRVSKPAPRTRRGLHRTPTAVRVGPAETLETRSLLTVGIDFDFTVIASDLSPDLRLFGSTDPADAPFEVIRYGEGVVTGLVGFESESLLTNPMDLTFEIGSMDTTQPVEVMRLDRDSFDDGTTNGVAQQNYVSVGSQISFFYKGELFGRAALLGLSLDVTPTGLTTGRGNLGIVQQATSPESQDYFNLRRLINRTFATNESGDSTQARQFTLGTFSNDGPWAGVSDAEIFRSDASMRSSDDFADIDDFATPWDRTSPWTGAWNHSFDRDFVKMDLDPTLQHVFRVDSTGTGGTVDFTSDFPDPSRIINFDGRTLNSSGSTWVTVRPQSSLTNMVISPQEGDSFTVTYLRSEPVPFNIYYTDDFEIAWTPDLDANGGALPVDGYRLEFSNENGIFHSVDVDAATRNYSLTGFLGNIDQSLRIGRIVNGAVASWSEPEYFRGVDRRPEFAAFDGRTLSWEAIPGVESYELYLGSQEYRVQVTGNSYQLPDNHPIGWRQAWIRAARNQFSYGGWSRPFNYHARSTVTAFHIEQNQITRPRVEWLAIPGADTYEIYIARVGGGFVTNPKGLTGTAWDMPTDVGLGRYRVWMRGVSAAGLPGRWSAFETFDVATNPVSATGTSSEVTFSWENPPGVSGVDLFISNGSTVIRRNNLTGTSWTETHDFENGWISWWVRGSDDSGNYTPWSSRQRVRVGSTEFVFHPTNWYNATFRAFFRWEPVLGASSYEVYFRSFTEREVIYDQGLTDTQYRAPQLPGNRYIVWVNTVFPDGSNVWSRSFTFDIDTQSSRLIVTPNGNVDTNTPTIEWSGASGRTRLWVRNETANTNRQVYTQDSSFSYTFTEPLEPGRYRIWAARWNSTDWGNSVVIIVTENDPTIEFQDIETLLALLPGDHSGEDVPPVANSHPQQLRARKQTSDVDKEEVKAEHTATPASKATLSPAPEDEDFRNIDQLLADESSDIPLW